MTDGNKWGKEGCGECLTNVVQMGISGNKWGKVGKFRNHLVATVMSEIKVEIRFYFRRLKSMKVGQSRPLWGKLGKIRIPNFETVYQCYLCRLVGELLCANELKRPRGGGRTPGGGGGS